MEIIERERLFKDLCGRVDICAIHPHMRSKAPFRLELGAVRNRLVYVLILPDECSEIENREIDLVTEQIVEIGRRERVLSPKQGLLYPRFESPVFFRLEIRIWNDEWTSGKCFVEPRF